MAKPRPNILLLLTDEERYPTCYEDESLQEFRRTQLPGQALLRAQGTEFHRHYAASVACAPSRASLFTGHYPTLHGVRATDGAAKGPRDADMFWLDPHTVPTMGHYFREAGYRTHYRGKWHISHADLVVPDTHLPLASSDGDGVVIPRVTQLYAATGRLEPFGFSGWIGPDPHGPARSNCGLLRDPLYGDQVDALFSDLEADPTQAPWLTVASFVNPHDIVLFGILWRQWGFDLTDDTVPEIPEPPTQSENLRHKPECQQDFVDKYRKIFVAQPQTAAFRQFYFYLHKLVDQQIQRVLARLQASRFAENTIVVYTSDHGDMLGAHGGMHQKWHNAYEETWRVPLLISGPGIPAGRAVQQLSSHVDLLPTMLHLAGVDPAPLSQQLTRQHAEAAPLVGRNLAPLLGDAPESVADAPIYLMSEDEVSEGLDQTSVVGIRYQAVKEPAKVEAVIARLDPGGPLWKLARYYEHSLIGETSPPRRAQEEFELYNLDDDPTEITNLAAGTLRNRASRAVQDRLEALLAELRQQKAVHPQLRVPV